MSMKKLATIAVAIATVVTLSGGAQAATTAELQAQITAMLATITALQAQLAAQGGTAVSYSFTTDLTLGSKGADVNALQQILISGGYLNIAAPTGYFGSLTKAALSAYQAAKGISPAAGYFGPKTRAFVATVTPVPTGTVSPTPTTTFIPGTAEGTVTVEYAPLPGNNPTVYAGDVNTPIFGLRIKPKGTDVNVGRVRVDLGTNNIIYTKIIQSLALYNGSTKLSEVVLNSSTVSKDATRYYIDFSGFSVIAPKDLNTDLSVNATFYSTVDTTFRASLMAFTQFSFL